MRRFVISILVLVGGTAYADSESVVKSHAQELTSLNKTIQALFNPTENQDMPKDLESQVRDATAGCFEPDKMTALLTFVNNEYRKGNTGPAMGFLTQKFRVSNVAGQLEKAYNNDCKDEPCRKNLESELRKVVADPKVFGLLFEAQLYPRVFHIENIPGLTKIDLVGKAVRYLKDGKPIWEDVYSRTFPLKNKDEDWTALGHLIHEGHKYMDYEICIGGYSPNFWPITPKGQKEMKTYLGECHGYSPFLYTGADLETETGLREFKLTDTENRCLKLRVFNPNRALGTPSAPRQEGATVGR